MGTPIAGTLLVPVAVEDERVTKDQSSWAADFDLDIRTNVIPHPQVENVNLTPSCSCGSCGCSEACGYSDGCSATCYCTGF